MITIRINAKTHEQTIISADDVLPAGKGLDALASILAEWIYEKGEEAKCQNRTACKNAT